VLNQAGLKWGVVSSRPVILDVVLLRYTMEYDDTYHLKCELRLDSGRSASLKRLHQAPTYAGVFMGTPTKKDNESIIGYTIKHATESYSIGKPHLIEPVRRDFFIEPGDQDPVVEGERVPEWLPLVECIANFQSGPILDSMQASLLTVIWYQDEFAMPVAPAVQDVLKSLNWESLATDVEL